METIYLLLMLSSGVSAVAPARAEPAQTPTQELTVPNFVDSEPACVVKVPVLNPQCTAEGCILPAPAGSKLDATTLFFSCLPKASPTGFERPVPEAKVQLLFAKNARGHFMVLDDFAPPPNERFRYLSFCLFGKLNNFCGVARVSMDYRIKVETTRMLKAFSRGIELQYPWTEDGR
ncbi:hypothetical protein [Duganella sp. CF517]|uniref:hypothetical protein n=1 Tax=Duganella sp. CF517 TaxID=1881038 RepID=UPI000B7C9CAD|nr:hypothetical protein [Duganella sp. CF517]